MPRDVLRVQMLRLLPGHDHGVSGAAHDRDAEGAGPLVAADDKTVSEARAALEIADLGDDVARRLLHPRRVDELAAAHDLMLLLADAPGDARGKERGAGGLRAE